MSLECGSLQACLEGSELYGMMEDATVLTLTCHKLYWLDNISLSESKWCS